MPAKSQAEMTYYVYIRKNCLFLLPVYSQRWTVCRIKSFKRVNQRHTPDGTVKTTVARFFYRVKVLACYIIQFIIGLCGNWATAN